jgi:glucokinase
VANVIGVDIGGTTCRAGLFDFRGRPLHLLEGDTVRSGGREWMLRQIRDWSQTLLRRTETHVKGCGISFGGPVDFATQRVRSIHTPGWEDFPLSEWVTENLGLPCRVDNDANCGALGEYHFGAGRGTRALVFLTISTGIGGGIVWDGKVYRGKDSFAGEFGHLPMADSHILCSCGASGCLETFCSGPAIARRARELAERRPDAMGRLAELCADPHDITTRVVFQAAAEGDVAAQQIVNEAARWLARALLMVIRIINPDKIILGGGVMQAGETFLGPIRTFLQEMGPSSIGYSTELHTSELGQSSQLYGAVALAHELPL